ncbi:MAG: sulfurtransferase TusA family protein [Firmicutes bacterium]|nr:sulfurtransferase TusA family protein [Bacillota bacterium]
MSDLAQVDKTVDARGSYCPGPLMELIKTVKAASVGQVIEVLSSDQGSAKDIPEWVKKVGHELIYNEKAQDGDYWRIAVKKVK